MVRKLFLAAALVVAVLGDPANAAGRRPATQAANVPIAMDFLATLGRLDFDAAALMLDEDAVLELPYVNNGLTLRGRTNIVQFFRQTMGKSVSGIVYKLDKAYPSQEAGAVVVEVSTQGRTATGLDYTNRLVGIFVFRDGKIVLFREYFNPSRTS
jgi:ketosteroid isomerase-like protein